MIVLVRKEKQNQENEKLMSFNCLMADCTMNTILILYCTQMMSISYLHYHYSHYTFPQVSGKYKFSHWSGVAWVAMRVRVE